MHVNLCLHTFTHMTVTLRGVGGRGLFKKFIVAEKCFVFQKNSWKYLKRSNRVLKCINAWNISLFCIQTKTVRV